MKEGLYCSSNPRIRERKENEEEVCVFLQHSLRRHSYCLAQELPLLPRVPTMRQALSTFSSTMTDMFSVRPPITRMVCMHGKHGFATIRLQARVRLLRIRGSSIRHLPRVTPIRSFGAGARDTTTRLIGPLPRPSSDMVFLGTQAAGQL